MLEIEDSGGLRVATTTTRSSAIFMTDIATLADYQEGIVTVHDTTLTITWTYNATMSTGTINVLWSAQ